MYIFLIKGTTTVYAYTDDKSTAYDYNELNSNRFRLVKVSKSDIREGITLPSGGNINYYKLYSEDGEFMVPLTHMEMEHIVFASNEIVSKFSYAYNEIVYTNKYGIKGKYLNLISELTNVLRKKHFMNLNHRINSLKIYQDMIKNGEI